MKQLHPRAVWLFFIHLLLRQLLVFLFLGFYLISLLTEFSEDFGVMAYVGWLLIVVFILVILLYIWAKLSYRFYKYELINDGFRKESGIIWKRYVTIPYDRIQNVDIYRGVWARILGLSDLHIQTAGTAGVRGAKKSPEGQLPGLAKEDAEKIRDELIKRAKSVKNQGL